MTRCKQCGHIYGKNLEFCPKCGALKSYPRPVKKYGWKVAAILAVLCVALAGVYILDQGGKSSVVVVTFQNTSDVTVDAEIQIDGKTAASFDGLSPGEIRTASLTQRHSFFRDHEDVTVKAVSTDLNGNVVGSHSVKVALRGGAVAVTLHT